MVKAVIIKKEEKPYFVAQISEITNKEFLEIEKNCIEQHKKEEERLVLLEKHIVDLQKQVKDLEHEIKVDRGEAE